jgi:hypothetical protein
MTTHLLTKDTVRADIFADHLARDWKLCRALLGGWSVAFGPVTQLMFLQEVTEVGELPLPPTPEDPAILEARDRQWLREINHLRFADEGITHYDLRTYDTRMGEAQRFLDLMLSALPIREHHSRNCGIWSSLSGRGERVLHLWGYRGLDERENVRAALKQDRHWGAYIATILPLLQSLESIILQPLWGRHSIEAGTA